MVTTTFLLASFLPLLCWTCSSWGRIWGRREETLFPFYLPYFNPFGMDPGVRDSLLFWSWGMRLLSPPSSLSPCLTQLEQTKWPRLAYSAVLLLDSSMPPQPKKWMSGQTVPCMENSLVCCETCVKARNYLFTAFSFDLCKFFFYDACSLNIYLQNAIAHLLICTWLGSSLCAGVFSSFLCISQSNTKSALHS